MQDNRERSSSTLACRIFISDRERARARQTVSISSLSRAMTRQIVPRYRYSSLRSGSSCCSAFSALSAARFRHSSANNLLIGRSALLRCGYLRLAIRACQQASQALLRHAPSAEFVEDDITVIHKFAHPLFEVGIVFHEKRPTPSQRNRNTQIPDVKTNKFHPLVPS
jgi:hypothetical protein